MYDHGYECVHYWITVLSGDNINWKCRKCICRKCGLSTPVSPPILYTSAELHSYRGQPLCNIARLSNSDIPKEIRRRKRGRPGGVRRRMRARNYKPYLPSVIVGFVQSLNSKIDELYVNTKYLHDFRTASLMSFTKTWLNSSHTDDLVNIDGFKLLRGDRTADSGKKSGGGVCVYLNEEWCHPNNASIRRYSCSENVEILTVNLRPYYLPCEFSHVIMSTLYVPDRNVAILAARELVDAIHDFVAKAPDALIQVDTDFNHCS